MRAALSILAGLVLGACAQDETVETFAANRKAAEAAVAACDAGRPMRGCDAARDGLAEAKRRNREILYRQAIAEPVP